MRGIGRGKVEKGSWLHAEYALRHGFFYTVALRGALPPEEDNQSVILLVSRKQF